MFCSQCATPLNEADVYCPNCSKPRASFTFDSKQIPSVEYIGETQTMVRPRPVEKASNKSFYTWLIGGGVAGFIFVAFFVVGLGTIFVLFLMPQNSAISNSVGGENLAVPASNRAALKTNTQSTPPPIEKPRIQITDSVFPVNAGKFVYFDFSTASGAKVTGGFRTYGGSNDINAYIVDDQNFSLLQQGLDFRSFFTRVQAERSKIDVTVPAGRIFVVFSNKHALLTGKEVAAEIYYQEK